VVEGEYSKAVYRYDFAKKDDFFLTANGYLGHDGRVVIFPVEPNSTYTIRISGEHNMFRVGIHNSEVRIPEDVASEGANNTKNKFYTSTSIADKASGDEFTFRNTDSGKYVVVYVSSAGEEPPITLSKEIYLLKSEYTDYKAISSQLKNDFQDKTSVVIEDAQNGYAPRPLSQSVTWIGPNEPTEAEPFDEWRETEGFIYFTDFTEYELDEKPHDWNEKFSTTTEVNKVITSRNYGGNVYWLRLETDNAPYAQSFERVFGEHLDSEIYMKARLDRITLGQPLTVVHRGKMKGHGKE